RHPGLLDRLHRHRGRAARPQLGDPRPTRRPALPRAAPGDVDAKPGDPGRDQARARRQPDADHPGARAALRRRGRFLPLALEPPEEDQGQDGHALGGGNGRRDVVVSALAPAVQQAIRSESTVRWACWAGIALSALGLWLVLPPVTLRSPVTSFILIAIGAACGAWAAARGETKLGWGGVAVAGICALLAYGATQSSLAHLDGALTTSSGAGVVDWGQLTYNMFVFATALAFASIGGMFAERSGVVNIGLEGMMLSGCFFGILGADKFNSWELGLLSAAVSGAVFGLIPAFFAIHMRADQIVGGTAINFLAVGVTGYFFIQIYGLEGTPGTGVPYIPDVKLSFLDHIPPNRWGDHSFWYNAFGHLNLMTWMLF